MDIIVRAAQFTRAYMCVSVTVCMCVCVCVRNARARIRMYLVSEYPRVHMYCLTGIWSVFRR